MSFHTFPTPFEDAFISSWELKRPRAQQESDGQHIELREHQRVGRGATHGDGVAQAHAAIRPEEARAGTTWPTKLTSAYLMDV